MRFNKREKLSVFIIAKDEEDHIGDCLDSVLWADEVVVVDAYSRDRTVDICRKKGVQIIKKKWEGFSNQNEFAFKKTKGPWVFKLDADERVTDELKKEILDILNSSARCDGYYVPRRAFFLGKWMKHGGWYPGYQMRLFRKGKAKIQHVRVHEGFVVDGSVGYLRGDIIHYAYDSIQYSLEKLNLFTTLEALDRVEKNTKRIRWVHFFLHSLAAFLRKYFGLKGYLDGIHGLLLALIDGMGKLALYMKMWELQNLNQKNR